MQCGNCHALCAPGVDFCLACKQPVTWDPAEEAAAADERLDPEEEAALQALRTVPPRDAAARQAYVRGTDRQILPPVVYSRFKSGPNSFSLPVKLILTVLILALAPVGGFWGFTALFALIYGPFAVVCLWSIWRKRSVGHVATEEKHPAVAWAVLGVILIAIVARAWPKHHEYPCVVVGVVLTARLDERASSMEEPAVGVPSGDEEGAWLVAADTTRWGTAVWATTADPADSWNGYLYTANDAAVKDSVEGGEYPVQRGTTPGVAAREDTDAINAAIACLERVTAQVTPGMTGA